MPILKHILIFFYILVSIQAIYSQSKTPVKKQEAILIPYRTGSKFGLSDDKGNIVVKPKHDKLEYLYGYKLPYFKYTNGLPLYRYELPHFKYTDGLPPDDLWYSPNKDTGYTSGLYCKSKLIIAEKGYRDYRIYDHYIASVSGYKGSPSLDVVLYSLNGRRLFSEPIDELFRLPGMYTGRLQTKTDNFSLISIVQKSEREKLYSIALYDHRQQDITRWLLRKVRSYNETPVNDSTVLCTYSDSIGRQQEKYMVCHRSTFEISDTLPIPASESSNPGHASIPFGYGDGVGSSSPAVNNAYNEMDQNRPYTDQELKYLGLLYYKLRGDTLYYTRGKSRTLVFLPSGSEVIFSIKDAIERSGSLIYRKDSLFGLIVQGKALNAEYDSLFYTSYFFIAAKKINGVMQYGLLNNDGNITVPFYYDSMPPGKCYSFHALSRPGRERYFGITTMPYEGNPMFYSYNENINLQYFKRGHSSSILVCKNGKTGMVCASGRVLLPVVYDFIARQNAQWGHGKNYDFTLLKQNNLYGLTFISYPWQSGCDTLTNTIRPVFRHIPCYYYNDYYNKTAYKLYAMYDENFNFKGYANSKGVVFYKD